MGYTTDFSRETPGFVFCENKGEGSKRIKIAICDSSQADQLDCLCRLILLARLHHIDVEFELYQKGEELLFHLEDLHKQPDIIYLEIKMEGMGGDAVATWLREEGYQSELIFYTASKLFYSLAFDVKAFHYMIKGQITDKKFEEIFIRAAKEAARNKKESILCTGAGVFRNIKIHKIRYFQVTKRIITVAFGENERFSFYYSIGKIEEQLKDFRFIRIHRSYLVASSWIYRITFQEVTLRNGETLPVGRSYYPILKKAMEEYYGI